MDMPNNIKILHTICNDNTAIGTVTIFMFILLLIMLVLLFLIN